MMSQMNIEKNIKSACVGILMGGPGREREVSLISGKAVKNALESLGIKVVEYIIDGDFPALPIHCDVIFNVVHGLLGEDGKLQEWIEEQGVPYVGSSARSCRISFDKALSKKAFTAQGLPTGGFERITAGKLPKLKAPYIIKPTKEGSSIGVVLVENKHEFEDLFSKVSNLSKDFIVEEYFSGREFSVSILDAEALPVLEIQTDSRFYNFDTKYPHLAKDQLLPATYSCPAQISKKLTQKLQSLALEACHFLEIITFARVDMILDEQKNPYLLEINSVPGMNETSLFPKSALAAGYSFKSLCLRLVESAMRNTSD